MPGGRGHHAGIFTGRVLRDALEQARGLSCTVLVEGSTIGEPEPSAAVN
jgi:hypothetical protein